MVEATVNLRSLECELGLLKRADGSARLYQGKTKVLCAVYGPAEVKISKEQSDNEGVTIGEKSSWLGGRCWSLLVATLEVTIKPESGLSSPRERLLEELVTSCCKNTVLCELHPHTALSITLQVENDDGLLLSTLINSCCLALLDACVPMTTVFSAVTCAYNKDGELVTDLTPQEEQECESVLTFVVDDSSGGIITSYATGAFSIDQLQQALSLAQEVSKKVALFYKESVKRKLSKDATYSET